MQSSPSFDRRMAFLGLWFTAGFFLDGWAHNHIKTLETFFTPWHAVMYTGYAVFALALFVEALAGRRRLGTLRPSWSWLNPLAWRDTMPSGYYPSLLGAALFAFGGAFDLVWHSLFGIERDIEALLSPAHLILAVAAFLMVTGPLRAAWQKAEPPKGLADGLPLVLSMTFAICVISFITQFAHPVRALATGVRPANVTIADLSEGRGTAGILLQLAVIIGMALMALRRWGRDLPFGTFTVMFGLNMAGMALMVTDGYEFRLLPAALLTGLLADWLCHRPKFSGESPSAMRGFAAIVPAAYSLLAFSMAFLTDTVWWSVHMWSGVIVMSGLTGLLVSYLVLPPARR